jgi:glycopeptide antibiotics resistance protein
LLGLAIYHSEIEPAEARRRYQTWLRDGRPELEAAGVRTALFLFDEHGGDWAYNQNSAGPDLFLPDQYELQDQAFLKPFWKEFELSWSYFRGAVKNIVGFVPLGFLYYAWFAVKAPARRAAWKTVLLGFAVSLTIEVLQGFLPTRDSGTTDLITNTLGTWLGVLLFQRVGTRSRV